MIKTMKPVHKPAIALTLLVGVLLHSPAYAEDTANPATSPQAAESLRLHAPVDAEGTSIPAMSPQAVAPKALYQSAFDGYLAWDDAPMKGWREAHEDVMGSSHAGHDKPATKSDASPGASKADPHAGHSMKHGGQH